MSNFLTALWVTPLVVLALVIVIVLFAAICDFFTNPASEAALVVFGKVVFTAVAVVAAAAPFLIPAPPVGLIVLFWVVAIAAAGLALSLR